MVARAFRDVVYCQYTAVARRRCPENSPLEWSELRVGMRVRMLSDQSVILLMFEAGAAGRIAMAPGATKPIGLGSLGNGSLSYLVGHTHDILELLPDKRGIRIQDPKAFYTRWLLPYTAFVRDVEA